MRFAFQCPLWPAGHLPHKGGETRAANVLRARRSLRTDIAFWALTRDPLKVRAVPLACLPPCGGDGRQARGGILPTSRGQSS
ncbi:hypothetical protein DFR48_101647 [Ciceribacter lividus]|uniref:Lytic murein transglycosylase n=1 Tax=Ciceribacter lividus TaxID=1197950 RepID=A0A6I7HT90_9HYPH|nr:hypothetical protein DFR48_101647 [Ciceribacter lividus]